MEALFVVITREPGTPPFRGRYQATIHRLVEVHVSSERLFIWKSLARLHTDGEEAMRGERLFQRSTDQAFPRFHPLTR